MVYGIKIHEENELPHLSLANILEKIDGERYFWSVYFLDATGDLGSGQSIPDFEKKIFDSENGVQFTWADLNSLAKKFYQVIDIVLVGCLDALPRERFSNDEDMFANCDVVVEMVDSSYWLIHSQAQPLITELSKAFKVEAIYKVEEV